MYPRGNDSFAGEQHDDLLLKSLVEHTFASLRPLHALVLLNLKWRHGVIMGLVQAFQSPKWQISGQLSYAIIYWWVASPLPPGQPEGFLEGPWRRSGRIVDGTGKHSTL